MEKRSQTRFNFRKSCSQNEKRSWPLYGHTLNTMKMFTDGKT